VLLGHVQNPNATFNQFGHVQNKVALVLFHLQWNTDQHQIVSFVGDAKVDFVQGQSMFLLVGFGVQQIDGFVAQ
jgi:hypothetical protein